MGGNGSQVVYYPDFRVAEISPPTAPIGVDTLFTIKVENIGQESGSTDTLLKITGPDGTHEVSGTSTTVSVGNTGLSFAKYRFTQPGNYQIVATANPRSTVAEESESNNSKADFMTAVELPVVAVATANAPERRVPSTPSSTAGYKAVRWNDNGTGYAGNLTIAAEPSSETLKSGYGFKLEVRITKSTDYVKPAYVYKPQKVYMYVPEWGYAKAVELKETSPNIWELPPNSNSPGREQKWYVPIWWPDNSAYTIKLECVGAYTPGDTLNASLIKTIRIDSNMYTDDYTTN